MSSNLQNSIWPNEGGTLGQIKVQIPDGVTTPWPTGDALVHNFVFHKGKLVGLVDSKALIANDSKTTTFPYDYVNISLPSIAEGEMTYNYDQCTYVVLNGEVLKGDVPTNEELEIITKKYLGCKTVADIKAVDPNYLTNDIINGVWKEGLGDLEQGGNGQYNGGMFYSCDYLTSFSSDLSSLTDGNYMFSYCSNLESFSSDSSGSPVNLTSLTDGNNMFYACYNLTAFSSDLSSLMNGEYMFSQCSGLESFTSDLSSLTDGDSMFRGCSKLTTFSSDLSSLTDGNNMFYNTNLSEFSSDLHSLTNGESMFSDCTNLNSFNSDLSSLTNAQWMFSSCKLDTASVQCIADTINTYNGKIDIDIGNSEPNEQEVAAFNKMASKGWTVYVNGSKYDEDDEGDYYGYTASASLASSVMTLDELGESEMFNPKPYWAKPINSDKQHARYVDSEGNFYNILGAQFIYGDNLETYGMFTCEDDAAAQMRLTKIEK